MLTSLNVNLESRARLEISQRSNAYPLLAKEQSWCPIDRTEYDSQTFRTRSRVQDPFIGYWGSKSLEKVNICSSWIGYHLIVLAAIKLTNLTAIQCIPSLSLSNSRIFKLKCLLPLDEWSLTLINRIRRIETSKHLKELTLHTLLRF